MNSKFLRCAAPALAAGLLASAAANAEVIYGITGGTAGVNLVNFDSATPGSVNTVGALSGMLAGHSVRAIDFRPANGQLYALSVAADGITAQLYTANLGTGALTAVGGGLTLTGNASTRVSIDFNPTVDRLRIVTGTGQNYRAHPDTGALVSQDGNLVYAAGDPGEGSTPLIAGAAYTNNFAGATTTTLFAWDFNIDNLVSIVPPNNGTLNTIGGPPSFVTDDGGIGFDISGVTGTAYFSYLNTNTLVESFATVDLATGLLTDVGGFGGGTNMLDISAVIPSPATASLFGLAGLGMLRRRR